LERTRGVTPEKKNQSSPAKSLEKVERAKAPSKRNMASAQRGVQQPWFANAAGRRKTTPSFDDDDDDDDAATHGPKVTLIRGARARGSGGPGQRWLEKTRGVGTKRAGSSLVRALDAERAHAGRQHGRRRRRRTIRAREAT
jgi:hypothetical protein